MPYLLHGVKFAARDFCIRDCTDSTFHSTLCSQHISRREHLQALLGAHCQLGQGQHVDTKDLEKGGDAGPAQLDCKVYNSNLDSTGKDQAASVLHLLE